MRACLMCMICFSSLAILSMGNTLLALDPIIILVGPPGAGKGTFSQYLKENYGYNHVSIGDILRREIEMQTELGCEIKEVVKKGDYIDSKVIRILLAKNIVKCQAKGGPFILDGFGQNEGEIEVMQKLLEKAGLLSRTFVLYLEASDVTCQERVVNRSVCIDCGYVYNIVEAKPVLSDKCDKCGMALKKKVNDSSETITKRLQHHRSCVEHYYKLAVSLFPSIIYDSSGSFEGCSSFYDDLAREAVNWNADSGSFVREFLSRPTN